MNIIFMGTPAFAVPSLKALIEAGYPVVAVITAQDKPSGRGQTPQHSAIKQYVLQHNASLSHGLAEGRPMILMQPEKLKNPEFLEQLKALNADLQVVVAFRMLPRQVWSMPARGTINLHGSILPQYRGAAPVNWAIIDGETISGVSTFFLDESIDTGKLIYQQRLPIRAEESAGEYQDRLMEVGAELIVKTVRAIEQGNFPLQDQILPPGKRLRLAPKLEKGIGRISWKSSAVSIHNLIRGLSPSPTAFTVLDGQVLKIFKASLHLATPAEKPGTIASDRKTYLRIHGLGGWIELVDIQLENKKRMAIHQFLAGYRGALILTDHPEGPLPE